MGLCGLEDGRDSDACHDETDTPATNMTQNLISKTMTDAQRDALLADLAAFDTKFKDFKLDLTPDQIAKLNKVSADDLAGLELALTYAQQNPSGLPGDVPLTEFGGDVALARQLVKLYISVEQKARMVRTSLIGTLSDASVTAGVIYRVAKAVGRTPANAAFLDAYGAQYAHSSKAKKPAAPGA